MQEKNFGELGNQFQQTLIKSIIEDKKYGEQILEVLDSKYFDNITFKYIVQNVKELFNTYNSRVPDYETVRQKITESSLANPKTSKIHIDTLDAIENLEDPVHTPSFVKDTALNFCKQQSLKKTLKDVDKLIHGGDFQSYDKIEEMIAEALQVGVSDDVVVDILDNISDALENDMRTPIPTGINGLDNLLDGGLSHGELGMVLAPTGTGKTTILTKFANTAVNQGKNVIQFFFEDSNAQIQRKHFTVWSGIEAKEQSQNKDYVQQKIEEATSREGFGSLKLVRLPNGTSTTGDIKRIIRKVSAQGQKPDLVLIDYIDCLTSDKSINGEEWKGEGAIIRSIESMCHEMNIGVWTAAQGNRQSSTVDVPGVDHFGGSIKKAQSSHIILSISRSNEQKENKTANVTLVKSRIGQDGITFSDCKFDNAMMDIVLEEQMTMLGFEQNKVQRNTERAAQLYKQSQGIKQ